MASSQVAYFSWKISTQVAVFSPFFEQNHKICCLALINTQKSVLKLFNFGKNSSTVAYKGVAYKKNRVCPLRNQPWKCLRKSDFAKTFACVFKFSHSAYFFLNCAYYIPFKTIFREIFRIFFYEMCEIVLKLMSPTT